MAKKQASLTNNKPIPAPRKKSGMNPIRGFLILVALAILGSCTLNAIGGALRRNAPAPTRAGPTDTAWPEGASATPLNTATLRAPTKTPAPTKTKAQPPTWTVQAATSAPATLSPAASATSAPVIQPTQPLPTQPPPTEVQPTQPPATGGYVCTDGTACIKGNINSSGEKIYHFPGCNSYNQTKIDEGAGERWFTTSADAEAAGWRRAQNCP